MTKTAGGKYLGTHFQKYHGKWMGGGQKPLQLTVQPLETGCRLLVDRSIWSPWPQCSFLTHLIVRRWQVRGGGEQLTGDQLTAQFGCNLQSVTDSTFCDQCVADCTCITASFCSPLISVLPKLQLSTTWASFSINLLCVSLFLREILFCGKWNVIVAHLTLDKS